MYLYRLRYTWTDFKICGDSNYSEKKYWISNGPNLRISMDTKFNIPRISKTYVSVAPQAAFFTSFEVI